MGLALPVFVLAQVGVESDIDTLEEAALPFSGPQFFAALIAGVLLAFAFQLLLTNLGVAAGISLLGGGSSSSSSDTNQDGLGDTINKIGFALGIATLITVTVSLFFACLLAVKLSLFTSAGFGAIVGLVIWATYFSLLVWFSSTTIGSLVGSVVNTATSGFQTLVGTAAAALGGSAVNKQVVATAEAAAAAVRRELGSAVDSATVRENLEDYIAALKAPRVDRQAIRTDFEKLFDEAGLQEISESEGLANINRQTFVDIVSNRSDLSKQEAEDIAGELESVWRRRVGGGKRRDSMADLVDYIKSASAEQLLGKDFSGKLDTMIDEMRLRREAQPNQGQGPLSQALTMGVNSLVGLVVGRTDLSDFDVEKVTNQLRKLRDQVGEQKNKVTAQLSSDTSSVLRTDVENYIISAYPWQLQPDTLSREFRDLLYDPAADPETVAQELEQISRSDFADWLQQKGVYTQDKIRELSFLLEQIRLEVLTTAQAAAEREKALILQREVEQYLLTTPKEELTPAAIQQNFKPILEDPDANYEQLSTRLAQFDRLTFERILSQRSDIIPVEASAIVNELEIARNRAFADSESQSASLQAQAESTWNQIKTYLQQTNQEELNAQAIGHELEVLLKDSQAGAAAVRLRASRFNREDLVHLLSQRSDLSEAQANDIIDQVERSWTRVRHAPQQLRGKVQEQYNQATMKLGDYLRNTGKEELNPEGISRDLQTLFADPQMGARAIRARLASMDRDTLVQLLAQREDLSEEQVNQVIDQVQETLRSFINAPRRLARRAQMQARSFQDSVADYLRSTQREELNPAGIQRDIQLLLNDPRAGSESVKDRLSQFDRATLVALLSQREDISEEEVNRIIDQVLAVRDDIASRIRSIQLRIEAAIENLIDRIRAYLNGLERPELNYDGIRQDVRTLFDDPQAGFDALRDRLSQVDRGTLVALLSSRQDISEADANRVIDQIEHTRNRVLQRAERIQQGAMQRVEQVKLQAQKQVEETRKAAAAAAWWLFFTALVSAIAAAGAGAIGVVD